MALWVMGRSLGSADQAPEFTHDREARQYGRRRLNGKRRGRPFNDRPQSIEPGVRSSTHRYPSDSNPMYAERPFECRNASVRGRRCGVVISMALPFVAVAPLVGGPAIDVIELAVSKDAGNFKWTTAMPAPDV